MFLLDEIQFIKSEKFDGVCQTLSAKLHHCLLLKLSQRAHDVEITLY